jgi:DNA repair protein RadA/Sms
MAKIKSAYFCQHCGYETPKWLGKCPGCGEWNTFVEEIIEKQVPSIVAFSKSNKHSSPQPIHTIAAQHHVRILLKDLELNRVLGGGLVPGSLILFGGEPGIGKSTLLLQVFCMFLGKKVNNKSK